MLFNTFLALPVFAVASVSGLIIGNSEDGVASRANAKRSCYAGGELWGNQIGLALDAVDKACQNQLVGNYNGKCERSACYNIGGGKRVNFNARRWHETPAYLDFDSCKKYLRLEIVGCRTGGISYQGNWRFMSDPNAGNCQESADSKRSEGE